MVYVVLFKGRGLISRLIEWQTRGEYSHAAMLIDNTLYEAWQGVGVRKKENWRLPVGDPTVSLFQFEHEDFQEIQLRNFLEAQIGKGYDYLGVLRFVTRANDDAEALRRWFCSCLITGAMARVGLPLFRNTKPWEISPDMIKRSLRLEKL